MDLLSTALGLLLVDHGPVPPYVHKVAMEIQRYIPEFLYPEIPNERTPRLWVISCAPTKKERGLYKNWYRADVVMLDPGIDECLRRVKSRPHPGDASWEDIVRRWYSNFEE